MAELMNWIDSKTIKYLFLTWLSAMLLQLVPMFQAHNIDWWALGTQSVVAFAGVITRMCQPDVVAPNVLNKLSLGAMNKNNLAPNLDTPTPLIKTS